METACYIIFILYLVYIKNKNLSSLDTIKFLLNYLYFSIYHLSLKNNSSNMIFGQ